MTIQQARIGLMLDIETLGKGSTAVVTQSALYGWDLRDPDTILDLPHFQYLPIQPQMQLFPPRTTDASTILWWMGQDEDARKALSESDSVDYDELGALLRHFVRAFERMAEEADGDWELWTRGNFDVPIMESLLGQFGLVAPWSVDGNFRRLRDLRTLEAISGVSYKEVSQPTGFIKHRADWDCKFQIRHHTACMKALGAARLDG